MNKEIYIIDQTKSKSCQYGYMYMDCGSSISENISYPKSKILLHLNDLHDQYLNLSVL